MTGMEGHPTYVTLRFEKAQGTIFLNFSVNEDGKVVDVKVLKNEVIASDTVKISLEER